MLSSGNLRRRLLAGTCSLAAIAVLGTGTASAQDAQGEPAKYQPFGEIVAHAGSEETGIAIEGWAPLIQGDSALLFVDGRIGATDEEDYYTNLGLGVRAIVGDSVVIGGYGYFDFTRDELDKDFYGATFGAEVLTPRFELRANYYLPTTENRYLGTEIEPVGTLTIEDNELLERRDTMRFDLSSMKGVDGEVGVKLFGAEDGSQDFRVYGGGYHYWDSQLDDIDGGYGEAEYRLHGVFGEGSLLSFAGRVSDDNWRGTEVSGHVRLRVSFGKPRGPARSLTGPESRMTERVRRRGTIVSQVRETPGTQDYNVTNALTGNAFGQFFFADGGNSLGVGDPDDPTTLGDAATHAGAGDYIVAEGGHGDITTTGITLADDVSLVGGGSTALSVRLSGGSVVSYTLGTTAGTIANTNAANDTITLGDGNYLAGLSLTGGANAIAGDGITDVVISDVTISGAAASGIAIVDAEEVAIGDATISGVGGFGVSLVNVGLSEISESAIGGAAGGVSITGAGTVRLSDLTFASTGGLALSLDGAGGDLYVSEFADLTVEGGNGETGGILATEVIFDANPGTTAIETVDGGDLAIGSSTDRVGGGGLVLDGVLGSIAFGDLDIYTDGGDGLYIRDGEGKVGTFAFANTSGTIDAIGGAAIDIDPVTVASVFDSLTSTGSPGAGLIFDHVSGSFTVTGATTMTGSAGPGIKIVDSDAEFTFGAVDIVDPEGDGLVVEGVNGEIEFGDTKITGLGAATGVDVGGAQGNIVFKSLDIEGTGAAGSKGIDMSGSTNAGFIGTTNPSSIVGVDIGIDLTDAAITGTFQFGDGSDTDTNGAASLIDATTPIVATNLGITGTYNLLDAQLVGDIGGLAGDDITIFFVDSTPGAGTASDPGTIGQAELSGADIIVLVNDGSGSLDAVGSGSDDTFVLADGQQLTGFYGQTSFEYTQSGPQANLMVHGLAAGTTVTVDDPTGNGGATLVSSAGDALTVSGNNIVDHVIVGDSAGYGVYVDGISGSVEISAASIDSLAIDGGSSTVSLTGVQISPANGAGVSIAGGHTGALTMDSTSSIAVGTGSIAFSADDADGTYNIGGQILSTLGGGIDINASAGTFDFTGNIILNFVDGAAISLTGANGAISFGTVDIDDPTGRGVEIVGATDDVTFTDLSLTNSGGFGVLIEDQGAASTITFDNLDVIRDDTVSPDSLAITNAAGTVTVTAGSLNNLSANDVVDISGGSATISIGATLSDSGTGNGIEIDGVTGGSIVFGGNYTRAGTGNAVTLGTSADNTGGTIVFGGNVTVSGGANIVIEGTNSVAFNGATNVSGATANSVDISGANGTVSFANLDIAMTADNTVGLDLNGATFSTGFAATDFDLTSTSATGTLGVDLRNASGVVRLGDIVASGGASASISGVATGVRADNTSNVTFTFGDGENTVDVASVIDAVTTAIDFTGNDGSVGTFNFVDVDWTLASNSLSYQNLLSEFTVYYIDAEGDGNGTAANPGSFDDAGALAADVLILVNQNGSGTDTIDLAGSAQGSVDTFQLADGQGLFSFNGGEQIDLAQYGYSMGGAPSNFTFTAISGVGTLIDNPGDGAGAPILTTTAAVDTLSIASGANVVLGGLIVHNDSTYAPLTSDSAGNVIIDDSIFSGAYGVVFDLSASGTATAGNYAISNSSFTSSGGYDGLRIVSGAGDTYTLTVTDSSFSGDTGLYAGTFNGGTATVSLDGVEATGSGNFGVYINRTSTGGALTVTELEDITVTGGSSGLSVAGATGSAEVTFDADPLTAGLQEVSGGNIHLGTSGSPLGISGLVLANVSGSLEIADLQAHVSTGSALVVDNAALETSQPSLGFTLSTLDGDLSVAAGTATYNGVFLRAIDADLLLDTVSIVGGDYGLSLDTITGVGTASNALTIADLRIDGTLTGGVVLNAVNGAVTITDGAIGAIDDPAGRAVSITGGTGNVAIGADVTKTTVGNVVYVTGRSSGTIAFSGAISATGGLSNGINIANNTGGTVNFTGPITLNGSGNPVSLFSNTGMTINFSGALDVTSSSAAAFAASNGGTVTVNSTGVATSLTSTAGGSGIVLNGITIGDAGITFDTVNVTNGGIGSGIRVVNVGQTLTSTGLDILDGSIAINQGTGRAAEITGNSADIYIGADLSNTATSGRTIEVTDNGRAGGQTIEFAGLIDENGNGLLFDSNDQNGGYSNVVLSGTVDIDTAAGATYGLLQQNGGNLTVTGAMDIDVTGNADGIVINNNGTFTSTFSSTSAAGLTITSENGNAFEAVSGGNISVTAQTSLTTTGVGAGLVLGGTNTGNTVTFNAGGTGLDIVTQGVGPGLYAIDGSTLSILGTGNSITTGQAAVMTIFNTAIGAGGVNFDALTGTAVSGGFYGIELQNLTGGTVAANTVNITGGSAGIYVTGAANVDFGTVTLTPVNTGIVLNATTGTLDFGDTTITNPGTAGVAVVTSTGGTVHFDDLDIALNQMNTVGVSLYGAALGAAITADDFDLTSSSADGTVGIDLTGATGDQTVQFGDTVVGGESSSIAGVATGVLFDDVSDINFVFGDGENTTDVGSSIAATTAIDFTNATGANGLFNFYDVFYPTAGSTDNLENAFDVYWIDEDGDGNGSLANPGNFGTVDAANADVLVVVNTDMTQDTIDLAGSAQGSINTYTLSDGQVLVSFNGGDTIDLTDYGLVGGGAPSNILLSGIVSGGTTLTNPFTGVTPIVTTTQAAADTFSIANGANVIIGGMLISSLSSAAVFGGDVASLLIVDSALSGYAGLYLNLSVIGAATTGDYTIRDSSFTGTIAEGLYLTSGSGDDVTLTVTDSSFSGTRGLSVATSNGGTATVSLAGIEATSTAPSSFGIDLTRAVGGGALIVTELTDITIAGGTGGVRIQGGNGTNEVTFDADPGTAGLQAVAAGDITIGAPGTPVTGNGLYLVNVAGQLDFGDIDIETTGGAGLTVNNSALKIAQPLLNFTLTSTGGTINSVGAPALYLDPLTVDLTFDSVSSSGGAYGIYLEEVAGSLNILAGTITGTTTTSAYITNSTLDFSYAGTLSNATGRTVSIDNQHAGTVTFSGAIDENANGIYLSTNTGGTIRFTGGLDIDNVAGTIGFQATAGGTIVVTGTNTIDTSGTGRLVFIDGVSAGTGGINFASLTTTGSATNTPIYLNNLDGTSFSGGTVTIAGVAGSAQNGIQISGGSAATFNFGATTIGGASSVSGDGIRIADANNGTITFDSVTINNTTGDGVEIVNATGAVNINGGSIGMSNDPAARGVYVNGGTGNVSIAAAIFKSSSGEPVLVDNHETGTVTFSGNIASFGPASPVSVTNVNSGIVNFTGQSITLNPVGDNAVFLSGNSGGTINFNPTAGGNGLDIVTTSGYGFYATGGGTITVTGADNTIQTATGPIIYLDGVSAGTGGINFASLGSTSATVAGFTPIYLNNLDGTSFSGGTVNIAGTGAGIDGIYIGGGSAATFDFTSATIANTGDEGIEINGAGNGTVTFGTVAISNTTGNGVVINGATNAVNINGGSIGAASGGWGVYVSGGTGNISIASNITKTTAGKAVEVDNHETGTVTFSGNISATGGFDNGILIQNVNSGTVNFTGQSIGLTTGANTAVSLTSNTGGTINFNLTGTGLDIATTSGTGFSASGGGTIAVTGSSNTIETTTGQIISLSGVSAGTGGINWASLTSTGTIANVGIYLNDLDGSTFSGGNVTIAGTSGIGGDGILISGGSMAVFDFTTAVISNTSDEGIEVNGGTGNGAVTFGSVTINGTAGSGIDIINATGAVSINGGSIGGSNDPAVHGVQIDGGTGNITIAANITKTGGGGNVVRVNGHSANTVTFSGNISATGTADNGISVTNVSGGSVNFTGQSIGLTTGTNTAVNLTNNGGATINFNPTAGGNGLDIVTTSGTGFNATGGGTVTVTGSGNTISTGTGSAFWLDGVTIGAAGITFQSIAKTGGTATGIYVKNGGTGGFFTVTGTGSTAASGGIISGITGTDGQTTTGIGAYFENTNNISLNNMSFSGLGNYAIRGEGVVNFTLRDSTINGTNGTAVGEAAIYFHNLTGLGLFEGNAISGGYSDNMRILNDSATGTLNLYVRDSANDAAVFGSNGTTNDGNDSLNVEVSGDNNLFMLVDGVQFTAWRGDAVQVTTNGTANSEITVRNSTFANTHSNIASGGGIGVLLTGTSSGAGWGVDYSIEDNTFTGSKGYAIAASFFGSYNGVIRGFIDGNTIGTSGGGYTGSGSSEAGGILAKVERSGVGSGNLTQYVTISNNVITDVAQFGINVAAVNGTGASTNAIIEATITNNLVSEMSTTPNVPYAALYMLAGGNDPDFGIVRASVTGNVFNMSGTSGAYAPIYLDQIFGTSSQYFFPSYVAPIETFLNGLNTITQGAAQVGGAVPVYAPDAVISAGSLQPAQTGSNTQLPTGG